MVRSRGQNYVGTGPKAGKGQTMWGQAPRLSFEMMIISVLLARYGVERVADVGFVESAAVCADRWEGSGRGRFSVEPKPLGIFQKSPLSRIFE